MSTTEGHSRRAMLGAGLGALAATVAGVIGRATPVLANGEPVLVGGEYTTATSRTRIRNQTNDQDVLSIGSAGRGTAVVAISNSSTASRHPAPRAQASTRHQAPGSVSMHQAK